jgi:4'-phosphopantetheinyl transferase
MTTPREPETAAPPVRVVVAYGVLPAHDLLRSEAARFHDVTAAAVVLGHACPRCGGDDHGRPVLLPTAAVRRPVHVSVARAGDLSVVAISAARPVGVDVEPVDAAGFPGFDDVALHPDERAATPAERTRAWVRKEALLKAYGLGLAVDPRHVRLDDHGLAGWDSPEPEPGPVRLRDLDVPGHVAAVAVLLRDGLDLTDLAVTLRAATP